MASTFNGSHTTPVQASTIRKGGYCMIQGLPCRVTDMSSAKTGKHGGTKIHFIAVDIFSGKRKEEIIASGDNVDQPTVVKTDFVLCDINDEGFLTLMDDGGETREDIRMPSGEHGAELAKQIQDFYDEAMDGKEILVNVMAAMGVEQVVGVTRRDEPKK